MSPESFDQFYAEHVQAVRRTVGAILRAPHEADDVVQDVFLQAWQQMDRYDPARGSIKAWLGVIARSRTIDRVRLTRRFESDGEWDARPGRLPDSLAETLRIERDGSIRGARESLTSEQERLIALAYEEGLSHSRIATVLGLPLGTVKTHIRMALRSLRDHASTSGRPATSAPLRDDGPFTIPMAPARQTDAWQLFDIDADLRQQLAGLRVTAIDDDRSTLDLIDAVLTRFGVVASTHPSVDAGIAAIAADWPDLVIADLDMPGEDGYACIARLRGLVAERGMPLPVVAFTGSAGERERSRVTLAGFDAYLTKPLHPLALLTVAGRFRRAQAA